MSAKRKDLRPIGAVVAHVGPVDPNPPRLSLGDRLDFEVFGEWMGRIGERLGRRLDDDALGIYYVELAQRLDTAAFIRGARAVFGRPLYGQWPGWAEFVEAASEGATTTAYAVPGVAETQRLLAAAEAVPPIDRARWRQMMDEARAHAALFKHDGSVVHVPRAD